MPLRRSAAKIPAGMPIVTATMSAPIVSSTVAGKCSASLVTTGWASETERPKSPCTK